MLIATDSKCPSCDGMVPSLYFWRKVGDLYFHICKKCLGTNIVEVDQIIKIGFRHGYRKALEDVKDKIGGLE